MCISFMIISKIDRYEVLRDPTAKDRVTITVLQRSGVVSYSRTPLIGMPFRIAGMRLIESGLFISK